MRIKKKKKLDYKQLKISDEREEFRKEDEEDEDDEKDEGEQKSIKVDYEKLIKQITDEEKDINDEILKNVLKFKGLVICSCF